MVNIEINGFRLNISFWLCAFAAAALATANGALFLAFAIASAAHEAAHVLSLRLCGARVRSLTLSLGKFELEAPDAESLPFLCALLVFLSGPAASGLLACAANALGAGLFSRVNYLLCAINLLPAAHLDGGRALALIFNSILPEGIANGLVKTLSFACGVAVCTFGMLVIFRGARNPTALLFGIYIILGTLRD